MEYSNEPIIYYNDQVVLYIEEKFKGSQYKTDMRTFIVYDKETDCFYVYGSRKCRKNDNYENYVLKFSSIETLYNYLKVSMDTKNSKLNITGYMLSGLTSDDNFDDFEAKTNNFNQLFGYDNIRLKFSTFFSYLNVLNTVN
jgi:hypothetical protein